MSETHTTARTREEILEELADLAGKAACAGDSIEHYEVIKEYVSLRSELERGPK